MGFLAVERVAPLLLAAYALAALVLLARAEAADPGYVVTITGRDSGAVADTIRQVSELVKRAGEPAPPAGILTERANRDQATIDTALRALGYYDATLTITVDGQARPMTVTIA